MALKGKEKDWPFQRNRGAILLLFQVTNFHEEITGVATSAVQEGVLEEMMEKVASMWRKTEFEVTGGEICRRVGRASVHVLMLLLCFTPFPLSTLGGI